MAGVKSTLRLNDGMSPVLRRINNVMDSTLKSFTAMQQASGQSFDLANINAAQRECENINSTIDEIARSCKDAETGQGRLNKKIREGGSAADGLWNKLKGVVATYASFKTVQGLANLSDDVTLAKARLDMMNDGLQTTAELSDMIFASAQRARGDYLDSMSAVAKLGNNAGHAFKSSAEIVTFTELIQKQFAIAGAGATESKNAMIQLTQALGSGVLRGDELNSIFEQAPNLIRTVADYMDVDIGKIRQLASEGKISASVVKNAMFASADEINAKFEKMPKTWGQIWIDVKNRIVKMLEPILAKINELANSEAVQTAINRMLNLFSHLATVIMQVFEWVCNVYNFIADNWSVIGPIILGIVSAILIYKAALLAVHMVQWLLNSAMWACPVTWIIAAFIALVVLFAIFTEQVVGAIYWLGALFSNIGLWLANLGIAIGNGIKNIGLWFANLGIAIWAVIRNIGLWFANLGTTVWTIIKNTGLWFANLGLGIWNVLKATAGNVGTAFHNAWISIQIGFWALINVIMQGLKWLAEKANAVLGWMGVNIDTSGLDFASKKIDELNAKKESYTNIADAWSEGFNTFAYDSVSDAWNSHEYGSVGDAFNTHNVDFAGGWNDGMNTFDAFGEGWGSNAYGAGAEKGREIKGWIDDALSFGWLDTSAGAGAGANAGDFNYEYSAGLDPLGYGDSIDGIGSDTGSIADAANKTNEELSYLRDIAEKEAINRFTTAEIKVDMTGMTNRIDSNMDIDGVIGHLTEELEDALTTAAEGVY